MSEYQKGRERGYELGKLAAVETISDLSETIEALRAENEKLRAENERLVAQSWVVDGALLSEREENEKLRDMLLRSDKLTRQEWYDMRNAQLAEEANAAAYKETE